MVVSGRALGVWCMVIASYIKCLLDETVSFCVTSEEVPHFMEVNVYNGDHIVREDALSAASCDDYLCR